MGGLAPYLASLASGGGGENPIVDHLRRMMQRSSFGPGFRFGSVPQGQPAPQSGAVPQTTPMQPALPNSPLASNVQQPQMPNFSLLQPQQPQTRAPFMPGAQMGPGPLTKTEPRAPLMFSWGKEELSPYSAGETDVLRMNGAPAERGGFMGASPISGGGGFSPSQQDWSKVANPAGFEAFRERPLMAEYERAVKDPLWRERETAAMERDKGVAIAEAQATAQANAIEQANRRLQDSITQMAMGFIQQANQARKAEGKPPLTLQEEQQFFDISKMRHGQPATTF